MLKRPILPLLALLVLILWVYRELAFTDHILGRGDTYLYFYPYWHLRDALLRAGQLPLWTQTLFMGAPLLADPQVGVLYPPNWLTVSLDTPNALRVSVLLHVAWAAVGAFWLARRALGVSVWAALTAGALFALGGSVGAHAEQINQLQGLAWMPFLFAMLHAALHAPNRTRAVSWGLLLGMAWALQILSGHTQTVFMSGVGMGVYVLALWRPRGVLVLAGAALLAALLASPQLVPTLELITQGGRSGGLSAQTALSFSLPPYLIGRALLPSYDGKLFSEYIAYLGVSGILLAAWGALMPTNPTRRAWLALAGVGLFFALGAYNPLNWLIVELPGFNLFRVPARWLILYTLGAAMLAAWGVQSLLGGARLSRRALGVALGAVIFLTLASLLSGRAAEWVNGAAVPTPRTLALWGVALILTFAALRWRALLIPVLLLELAAAGAVMPFTDLIPSDTWHAQRFSISTLRALTQTDADGLTSEGVPPARLLSISGLLFDPGDKAALSARYATLGMSALEERYAFVTTKQRETLAPNLPAAWGIPTIDGFGGGLLPTRHYNALLNALAPQGVTLRGDGRLQEYLARAECGGACLPALPVLTQNAYLRYLLVDKVFDVWHEGVAFDTFLRDTEQHWLPAQTADSVQMLYRCPTDCALQVSVSATADGDTFTRVEGAPPVPLADGLQLARVALPRPQPVARVRVGLPAGASLWGVSLVDTRTGIFWQANATPDWERILSSDVKLYALRNAPAYATLYPQWTVSSDDSAAPNAQRPVIHGEAPPPTQTDARSVGASPRVYQPTRIEFTWEQGSAAGMLVLPEAYYPGWRAKVDGQTVNVYRANVNLSAILLPADTSHVIFEYAPWWFPAIFVWGAIAWALTSIVYIVMIRRKPA